MSSEVWYENHVTSCHPNVIP